MRYKTYDFYKKEASEEKSKKKQTEEIVENMNIYIYTNIKQTKLGRQTVSLFFNDENTVFN